MSSQKEKYHMGMAGEYYVAAQLQRLQLFASITYGNAKKADVIVLEKDSDKAIAIEVKTSQRGRWVVGSKVPKPSDKLWIFVHIPKEMDASPEFYIMTQKEIHDTLKPIEDNYLSIYRKKHGEEYGNRKGVTSMTQKIAKDFENKWETIRDLLKS